MYFLVYVRALCARVCLYKCVLCIYVFAYVYACALVYLCASWYACISVCMCNM